MVSGVEGASAGAACAPWIEADGLEDRLARANAPEAHKAFARDLARDGLAIIDLGDELLDLCARIDAETARHFEGGAARVHDAWRRSPAIREMATHPEILARLALAYGRRPFPFQSLNFHRGSQQDVHADTLHFHAEPAGFMCGVWLALEDVRPGAGPLVYYPGSHRLPVLTMAQAGAADGTTTAANYNELYGPAILRRLAEGGFEPRLAMLRKGQVAVWAANLAHGGSRIADPDMTRRSLVLHYYFDDCIYYTPMLSTQDRQARRLPADIATGGWRWPRRAGRRVGVPVKQLAAAIAYRLTRHTPRF
jgi:hypothetical protein